MGIHAVVIVDQPLDRALAAKVIAVDDAAHGIDTPPFLRLEHGILVAAIKIHGRHERLRLEPFRQPILVAALRRGGGQPTTPKQLAAGLCFPTIRRFQSLGIGFLRVAKVFEFRGAREQSRARVEAKVFERAFLVGRAIMIARGKQLKGFIAHVVAMERRIARGRERVFIADMRALVEKFGEQRNVFETPRQSGRNARAEPKIRVHYIRGFRVEIEQHMRRGIEENIHARALHHVRHGPAIEREAEQRKEAAETDIPKVMPARHGGIGKRHVLIAIKTHVKLRRANIREHGFVVGIISQKIAALAAQAIYGLCPAGNVRAQRQREKATNFHRILRQVKWGAGQRHKGAVVPQDYAAVTRGQNGPPAATLMDAVRASKFSAPALRRRPPSAEFVDSFGEEIGFCSVFVYA